MVKFIHCVYLHLDSPFKSKSYLSPNILKMSKRVHMKVLKHSRLSFKTGSRFYYYNRSDLFDSENRTLRAEVF